MDTNMNFTEFLYVKEYYSLLNFIFQPFKNVKKKFLSCWLYKIEQLVEFSHCPYSKLQQTWCLRQQKCILLQLWKPEVGNKFQGVSGPALPPEVQGKNLFLSFLFSLSGSCWHLLQFLYRVGLSCNFTDPSATKL